MARQTINIGTTPNDNTGDPARTAFTKVNDNFTELYSAVNPVSGNITPAAGKGIDFSASAGGGATSSLFDDYEEGTFPLQIADAPTGGNAATFTVVTQEYTKNGDEVFINIEVTGISTAGMTGANTIYLRGLPFTVGNNSHGTVKLASTTFSGSPVALATVNRIIIVESNSGGAATPITVGDLTSGSAAIAISILYKV